MFRTAIQSIPPLLRVETSWVRSLIGQPWSAQFGGQCLLILAGAGVYGAVMGWWRSPVMGLFNFIKFPLVVLAVSVGNALLNGMLAPLLGLDLRFRDSLRLVVMSCALAAVILGCFAPVMAFVIWSAPPLVAGQPVPFAAYRAIQLLQVAMVAFAGVTAHVRLFRALEHLAGSRRVALRVLLAWLSGNLLLGSQLCWILRPFIGMPQLPVQFLRDDALRGSFFETLLSAIRELL